MKFKVGDHVIGNDQANSLYGITRKGWQGVVTKVVDEYRIVVCADPHDRLRNAEFDVLAKCFDLIPRTADRKILVTTDGTTTTARLFDGKTVLKSAEAKCSPKDEFNFETGAALAVDRLLGKDATAPKPFSLTYLSSGRFGRTNLNKWFVVVEDRLVYMENGDGWDDIAGLSADGVFASGHRIDFVVAGYSLRGAKDRARKGNYIWKRNK